MYQGCIAMEPNATRTELLFRVDVREKIQYLNSHTREMRDGSL
jgi:hypothetical protein